MIDYQKLACEKINQLEEVVKSYSISVRNFTYITFFQAVQQLYFQEEYRKVITICDTLIILDGVSEQNTNNKGD